MKIKKTFRGAPGSHAHLLDTSFQPSLPLPSSPFSLPSPPPLPSFASFSPQIVLRHSFVRIGRINNCDLRRKRERGCVLSFRNHSVFTQNRNCKIIVHSMQCNSSSDRERKQRNDFLSLFPTFVIQIKNIFLTPWEASEK